MSKPVPKRPLTDDERAAIKAIQHVGMPAGCWDKRFRRDVLDVALETGKIGEKSVAQLWRLFIRYRRQIPAELKARLMRIAESYSAPDFRKLQAAANAQAKIDALFAQQRFIIVGGFRACEDYARQNRLSKKQIIHVWSERHARGLHPQDGLRVIVCYDADPVALDIIDHAGFKIEYAE